MSKVEGFAAIPNWVVRDESVSIHAITVYVALASHSGPGGIHPGQSTLAREARCSESSVRRALNELEALGVVERVRRKDKRGRASNGYVLHPNGHLAVDETPGEVAVTVTGTAEVPVRESGGSGQGAQITPLYEEEPIKKMGFAEFYMAYPRKVGKEAARRSFEKAAKTTDPQLIVDGARRYAADPNLPEKQFIPHPATWLNAGRWDDEPEVERPRTIHAPSMDDFAPGDEWMAFNR